MKLVDLEWKYLIVLDACRYDYFKKVYQDYLIGKLKKIKSTGTFTSEWLATQFTDYYEDIVYVSGNSYINSFCETNGFGFRFDGRKHFPKIYDVWDYDWSDEYKTAMPQAINRGILRAMNDYPNKRITAHYMQPHFPYISENYKKYNKYMENRRKIEELRKKTGNKLWDLLKNNLNIKLASKVAKLFGLASPKMMIINNEGISGLRRAYEENLREVLKEVVKIIPKLNGKVVITADHGELLGEHGKIGHYKGVGKYKELWYVPYFEVKGINKMYVKKKEEKEGKRIIEMKNNRDKEKIVKERLRALGYYV